MSASESAAESSSRARQDSETEPERSWVALVSAPRILAAADQRALAMAPDKPVELDLLDPPKSSFLVLHPRIVAPDPDNLGSAYVLAADRSGRLLFRVITPGENDVMYLCNAHARRVITLPAVPYARLRIEAQPLVRRSIGLIADPHPDRTGHFLIAQLYPRDSALVQDRLLCYSTATSQWFLKTVLYSAPRIRHNPCSEAGVLTHGGRLYWLSLAYCVFVCDPFAATSHLRVVPLPPECEMMMRPSHVHPGYIRQRRRIGPSQGLLRFVEIRGLSYEVYVVPDVPPSPVNPRVSMWTLVDPDAEQPWRFEDEAPFAEVWEHPSYAHFGLPHGEVPHAAFVDPDNLGVVYLLQGDKLYGLDMGDRRVVSCEDFSVRDDREIRNCRNIIDAWELPPPPTEPSAPDGEPKIVENGHTERKDRWMIQKVESWLERLELTSETGEGPSSSSG